jgi:ribosomal protein S18 acetylase RimI-like enzyme
VKIRAATTDDQPLLAEMIVEAAFPPGRTPAFVEAVAAPHVVPWLEDWMRPGDLGVVAEDHVGFGAAWCRSFSGHEVGLSGFIDVETPVLAIAVHRARRGRGTGTVLLDALLAALRADGRRAVSLSVGRTNPALRLYERAGFERVSDEREGPLRLRRPL